MFCVFFAATWIWALGKHGALHAPPLPYNKDGVFYDNIALSLAHGRGFSVDLKDEEWRERYEAFNTLPKFNDRYSWVVKLDDVGPTALRSPVYPTALAAIYRSLGWRWDVARLGGIFFVSAGLSFLVTWSWKRWGIIVAATATSTLILDYSIMHSAGIIASESLAVGVVALLFVAAVWSFENPGFRRFALVGVLFAFLMLLRGSWQLGLLLMLCGCLLLLFPGVRSRLYPVRTGHVITFFAVSMLMAMPWWVRNCLVSGHFQPFGSAGANGMVAAYCDESLLHFGNWQSSVYRNHQSSFRKRHDVAELSLAEREYLSGRESLSKSLEWSRYNWYRLPKLMLFRFLSHWGLFNESVPVPAMVANIALLVVGFIGCVSTRGRPRQIFLLILVIDALVVMLTWAHVGRYAIPIRPLLHIGYGVAISLLFHRIYIWYSARANAKLS